MTNNFFTPGFLYKYIYKNRLSFGVIDGEERYKTNLFIYENTIITHLKHENGYDFFFITEK